MASLLSTVQLTLDLYDGSGRYPVSGTASFVPSAVLTDAGVEIVGQQPITVTFRAASLPTVTLLATDNSGPQPTGWTWGVTFAGITGAPAGFSFFLPAAAVSFSATSASPSVFTVGSGSAPVNGTGVQLSGSPPSGFTSGTTYYVVSASGTTFELAATSGGSALGSTSTGSGTVTTVSQVLSNLIEVSPGATFQAYMPLPSGTPSAGQVPVATGSGEGSAWSMVSTGAVSSVFGRSGTVTAASGDYTVSEVTGAAPLASPALTGTPTAPTASPLADSTQVATTAYADSAVAVETSRAEGAEALKAPLASPSFTGNPVAPTQSGSDNSTKLATTAFVMSAVGTETTRAESAEALLAPLASPALTGSPTAPTKSALTSNTDIATTAYADAAVGVETTRATTAEAGLMTRLTRVLFTVPSRGSVHTAAAWEITSVDTTSGSGTVDLPNAPAAGTVNEVKDITLGTGNTVTIACQGSDVIDKTGGSASSSMPLLGQGKLLHYNGSGIWTVLSDDLPLGQLDLRYVALAGGTAMTGNLGVPVKTVTTTNTTLVTDCVTLCNASGGGFTNTLADATLVPVGAPYTFKKTDTTSNEVELLPVSSQTVDGATYLVLAAPNATVTLRSDGSNWWVF